MSILILTIVMPACCIYVHQNRHDQLHELTETTSNLPRSTSVWSVGASWVVGFGGLSASCELLAGVGVAVPEAGAAVVVVEDEGADTPANA